VYLEFFIDIIFLAAL